MSLAPIPMGLLLAQFISNMVFELEDTYFTRIDSVWSKIMYLNISMAILNALVIMTTFWGFPDIVASVFVDQNNSRNSGG